MRLSRQNSSGDDASASSPQPPTEIPVSELRSKLDRWVECAAGPGQVEAGEPTGSAGLSKDESHEQAPFPYIEFKRQVAQKLIIGETLHALSKRHDISIRVCWCSRSPVSLTGRHCTAPLFGCRRSYKGWVSRPRNRGRRPSRSAPGTTSPNSAPIRFRSCADKPDFRRVNPNLYPLAGTGACTGSFSGLELSSASVFGVNGQTILCST